MTLGTDGAQLFSGALSTPTLENVERILREIAPDQAGVRLYGVPGLRSLLSADAPIGSVAVSALGSDCFPVRAILFDKSAATNWALGWHQDRTIAVRDRVEVPGFGPWTRKRGALHVAPPIATLESMVTLRIHVDAVPDDNAPLLIARGSHRLGLVAEPVIDSVVARLEVFACLAKRGDVWMYATPILHASKAASAPGNRRVLQVDYAAAPLPGGLEFSGI